MCVKLGLEHYFPRFLLYLFDQFVECHVLY